MNLAIYRKKAGLNQAELAQLLGVGASTVSAYETGARTPPIKKAHRIVEVLRSRKVKCKFDDIFPPAG